MIGAAPQVTVVVAAYNEAQALPLLHPRILASLDALEGVQGRVLYVDDGSRDDTWAVMRALAADDPRVSLLRLSRNFGKEAALTAGAAAEHVHAVGHDEGAVEAHAELADEVGVLLLVARSTVRVNRLSPRKMSVSSAKKQKINRARK